MTALQRAKVYGIRAGVDQVVHLLSVSSKLNLVRVLRLVEALAPSSGHAAQVAWLRKLIQEGHPAGDLAMRLFREVNPTVRRRLLDGLFFNNVFRGYAVRREFREKYGFRPPSLIVISPSMRCNLRCYGCYAWEYSKAEQLEPEVFERLLNEAEAMGVYFLTISGGEPFLYEPLLPAAERHPNMVFQVYTNGSLIDEDLARRIAELGNVFPAISVEGLEAETDERRGTGAFAQVCAAMGALRRHGAMYGFSCTATRRNTDVITRPEFVDFWVDQGCYWGWFFTYIPIGREPDLSLMQTPEQRDRLRAWTLEIRRTRPLFVGDFWNDGHLTGGCMAGGRRYLHINHRGDVEPCVFCHFAVDNIHDKSLAEALASPFFRAFREQIPYQENLLRPCAIIDNPSVLREAVTQHGARSTDGGGPNLLEVIAGDLDAYAEAWARRAEAAWSQGYEWAKEGGLLSPSFHAEGEVGAPPESAPAVDAKSRLGRLRTRLTVQRPWLTGGRRRKDSRSAGAAHRR